MNIFAKSKKKSRRQPRILLPDVIFFVSMDFLTSIPKKETAIPHEWFDIYVRNYHHLLRELAKYRYYLRNASESFAKHENDPTNAANNLELTGLLDEGIDILSNMIHYLATGPYDVITYIKTNMKILINFYVDLRKSSESLIGDSNFSSDDFSDKIRIINMLELPILALIHFRHYFRVVKNLTRSNNNWFNEGFQDLHTIIMMVYKHRGMNDDFYVAADLEDGIDTSQVKKLGPDVKEEEPGRINIDLACPVYKNNMLTTPKLHMSVVPIHLLQPISKPKRSSLTSNLTLFKNVSTISRRFKEALRIKSRAHPYIKLDKYPSGMGWCIAEQENKSEHHPVCSILVSNGEIYLLRRSKAYENLWRRDEGTKSQLEDIRFKYELVYEPFKTSEAEVSLLGHIGQKSFNSNSYVIEIKARGTLMWLGVKSKEDAAYVYKLVKEGESLPKIIDQKPIILKTSPDEIYSPVLPGDISNEVINKEFRANIKYRNYTDWIKKLKEEGPKYDLERWMCATPRMFQDGKWINVMGSHIKLVTHKYKSWFDIIDRETGQTVLTGHLDALSLVRNYSFQTLEVIFSANVNEMQTKISLKSQRPSDLMYILNYVENHRARYIGGVFSNSEQNNYSTRYLSKYPIKPNDQFECTFSRNFDSIEIMFSSGKPELNRVKLIDKNSANFSIVRLDKPDKLQNNNDHVLVATSVPSYIDGIMGVGLDFRDGSILDQNLYFPINNTGIDLIQSVNENCIILDITTNGDVARIILKSWSRGTIKQLERVLRIMEQSSYKTVNRALGLNPGKLRCQSETPYMPPKRRPIEFI